MPKLAERQFTSLEEAFLSVFFTGVAERAPVYAAKATVSSPLWAFLAGAYSRTQVTMREKLLVTLFETVGGNEDLYLETLQRTVSKDAAVDLLMERVEKFLSKWAVDYGHNSLKDSAVDRFAIEVTSIRGAKILERSELGAYQEKSTRYVDFGKVEPLFGCAVGEGQDVPVELRRAHDEAMALYSDITNAATEYYMPRFAHLDVAVASRTAKAKAFDTARYCLPAYLPTALGITMPSRETERVLRDLLSHEFPEMRAIGAALLKAGIEVNPALLRHVSARPKQGAVLRLDDVAFDTLHNYAVENDDLALDYSVHTSGDVYLTCAGPMSPLHPRWAGPAAMFAEFHGEDQLVVALRMQEQALTDDGALLQRVWEAGLAEVGPHDEYPEALDAVSIHFEGKIDFGAYRDLQRHRRGHQPDVQTHKNNGYAVPDLLSALDPDLLSRYHRIMQKFTLLRDDEDLRHFASYLLLLGHNVHFSYTCSLRQALYIIRLRTGPAGHESYRSFCQDLARTLMEAVPELGNVITVDWSVNTDRSEAEKRREAKLQALNSEN